MIDGLTIALIAVGVGLLALIWRHWCRRKVVTSITVPLSKGALIDPGDIIDVTFQGVSVRYEVLSKRHDFISEQTTLGLWKAKK